MAKKKRKPPRKPVKPGRRSRPQPRGVPGLPDRRALEGLMRDVLEDVLADDGGSSLDRAQQLIFEAFGSDDPDTRVALARKALEVSPDCADAYVILAENARSHKEALELYKQGVVAGARVLGPELFRDAAGWFWGMVETRPYMRAKFGLAEILWISGRRDEAIEQLREMLRLNPVDDQGVRFTLAAWLVNLGRADDLERLLDAFPDEGSTAWAYTRALLAYRREGDSPGARELLREARERNPHVPGYLLGFETLPREQPSSYSQGDANDAIIYTGSFLGGWRATPGSLSWLKEQEKPSRSRRSAGAQGAKAKKKAKPKGPTAEAERRLAKLEQEFDVWQADCRQLPQWLEVAGEPVVPWVVLVTSKSGDLVLAYELTEEEPTSALLWDKLAEAMRKPVMGDPHRPTALQYLPGPLWDPLTAHLEAIGIPCEAVEELDQLDHVFKDMREQLGGNAPPGLLEMPGVEPPQVAGFYEAAASFYREASWRQFGYESAVEVACDRFQSGPWYAVVMGQSGLTIGLALYEDLETLRRLWTGRLSDEENARETVALTVTFDLETDLVPADRAAIRQHGWELAGPEAYPSVFRKERGMSMRPPLAWELGLMEGCLRALPGFISRHEPEDPSPETVTVPTASGALSLVLKWVGN